MEFLRQSDTFFLSTYHPVKGADASHRGGFPGFIRVPNETQISWPDYSGNGMFMSLGNIVVNPIAGILVINFETGKALQISGEASINFHESSPGSDVLDHAERTVNLKVKKAIEHGHYSPYHFKLLDYSPYNPNLSNSHAEDSLEGEELELVDVIQETHDVKTFVFRAKYPVKYQAGMYASFYIKIGEQKVVRTWTISSSPQLQTDASCAIDTKTIPSTSSTFSITVKRKDTGLVSKYIHDMLKKGTDIRSWFRLQAIAGDFTPSLVKKKPAKAIMFAGGIGITPLRSMIRSIFKNSMAEIAEIVLVYIVQTEKDVAFSEELSQLRSKMPHLKVHLILTRTQSSEKLFTPDVHNERLSIAWMKTHLPNVHDYEVFLCGPESFMQAVIGILSEMKFGLDNLYLERFNF